MAKLTRWGTWALILAALSSPSVAAAAESIVLTNAKLVWTQGNRAYIASRDSLPLQSGSRLEFRYRHKIVAQGEVEAVYEDELVAAVVTGSFEKVKHLDQVEITAIPFQPPLMIRIGYPAAGRGGTPLFDGSRLCARLVPDTAILGSAYRSESLTVSSVRWVRTSRPAVAAIWPDTLLIRFYDEVTDEEIALERGDIDVAVFWPGEASTHIRDAMGWLGPPSGSRKGLLLVGTAEGTLGPGISSEERSALDRLNKEVFHGDLVMFGGVLSIASGIPEPRGRFEVSDEISGKDIMERSLRNSGGGPSKNGWDRTIRLELGPVAEGDSIPNRLDIVTRIGLGCPTIASKGSRRYVERLDQDALVNLFRCIPLRR